MMTWLAFIACTATILFTGTQLSIHGDVLGEKTGLGGTWIGVILMASVTSLPELLTGVSSVVIFDLPNIAVGDVLGSCMFNLLILSMLDIRNPEPLSARIHQGHVISAGFGIIMLGLVLLGMEAGAELPQLGWIGIGSLLSLGVYVLAMKVIFVAEQKRLAQASRELAEDLRYKDVPVRRAAILYAVNAVVLVVAAVALPELAAEIAAMTGLGQSFVGTFFVAMATSLPEIAVSAAALRIGALDMAASNLFGSNLFNIAILGIDDVLYTKGRLLAAVTPQHLVTATAAIVMSAVAIIGLTFRASRKPYRVSWDSLGMMAVYALAVIVLLRLR
ncbi:MAG: sodium:calcium antiporter [Acidobacteriota bacterium]|nr:sodium:calcium antiporter [Acidobacteriota bacterium]